MVCIDGVRRTSLLRLAVTGRYQDDPQDSIRDLLAYPHELLTRSGHRKILSYDKLLFFLPSLSLC